MKGSVRRLQDEGGGIKERGFREGYERDGERGRGEIFVPDWMTR